MITAVVFDADETLIDLQPAIVAALDHVVALVREHDPASALVRADLQRGWHEVFAEDPSAPVVRVRGESLRRVLTRQGHGDIADRMFDEFFETRFRHSRPFEDALPMLARLRADYLLGYATNGNSLAHRCGLGGEFAFELYAHTDGLPKKPDAAFFGAVAAAVGQPAGTIVYVGDNYEHDIVAPAAAGMRTVWVNRSGEPAPDAVISRLADLPSALGGLR
jgi:FMN hydrolase / 5-amino-6-(5-phospho-D-ribitylamino)uracil phosphatase